MDTFLTLCQEGYVVDVPKQEYTKSIKNGSYAIKAVNLLRRNSGLSNNPKELWIQIMGGEKKSPNHQMDVVTALWNGGFIVK